MRNNLIPYEDNIYEEGYLYTVGTNGREFLRVQYKGTKLYNGKPMMVFRTVDHKKLVVNPSFHTFVVEETTHWSDGIEEELLKPTDKKESIENG